MNEMQRNFNLDNMVGYGNVCDKAHATGGSEHGPYR